MSHTYLDYNASTPLSPGAKAAIGQAMSTHGNPSAVHFFGRDVRSLREDTRRRLAHVIDAAPEEIVFTSSGSEANAWAVQKTQVDHVITFQGDHVSVLKNRPQAAACLPLQKTGIVDLVALEEALQRREGALLVSLLWANNETGVIQPLQEIVALIRKRPQTWIHVDAVQMLGKMPLSFRTLGVDMMTLSAHKCGGPQGIGCLVLKDGTPLAPLILGGGQEKQRRAGTENILGIAGWRGALEDLVHTPPNWDAIRDLRDHLEAEALAISNHTAQIFGKDAPRLPNTSCMALPGVDAELQVMRLDLEGVAVSAGAACSSGTVRMSHVLTAMGAGDLASQAIRVSLGATTTLHDIHHFLRAWRTLVAGKAA